jgi:N-methylhydantoinase A
MAYGGSGPVHAADYAAGLGIRRVVVPAAATVYSALGAAMSDVRFSLERPIHESLAESRSIRVALDEMADEVTNTIVTLDVASQIRLEYWADVRYEKQIHSLRVPIAAGGLEPSQIAERFVARYRELYGEGALLPDVGVRVLRVGVDGIGFMDKVSLPTVDRTGGDGRLLKPRSVYWPAVEAWHQTDVWDGSTLPTDLMVVGPALIEFPGTTIAVPHGVNATCDPFGNVTLELGAIS